MTEQSTISPETAEAYRLAVQVESHERDLSQCNARLAELGLAASSVPNVQQPPEFSSSNPETLLRDFQVFRDLLRRWLYLEETRNLDSADAEDLSRATLVALKHDRITECQDCGDSLAHCVDGSMTLLICALTACNKLERVAYILRTMRTSTCAERTKLANDILEQANGLRAQVEALNL